MFGLSELIGLPPAEIALATAKGSPIGNCQGAKVSIGNVLAFRNLCQSRPNWVFRRDSEGLYNCAGLVWASRRTGISENEVWRKILLEDGYRKITVPLLDDLVLYRDSDDQSYLHVGRIIGLTDGVLESSPKIPIVLSKWGHNLGESVHFAHDHGLDNSYNVDIEYWTDRQNDEQISKSTRITY